MTKRKKMGRDIFLQPLDPADVDSHYVGWMNDPEVVRYLESRWYSHNLESIRDYVREMNDSPFEFLFGIFLSETGQHIGNIKIGEVNPIHKFGNIGLLIREKNYWGRGIGTQAIVLATGIAFEEMGLHCLTAGICITNCSSYRAFKKAGWEDAGIFRKYRFLDGEFVDQINVQICNNAPAANDR